MKEEIKQALEQATQGTWREGAREIGGKTDETYRTITAGRGVYDDDTAQGFGIDAFISEYDAHLIANAPTWLQWQNERIEQLETEKEVNKAFYDLTIKERNSAWREIEELKQWFEQASANVRRKDERIEQLEQALVKIATKDIALKVNVLKDIARQALGKEE